MSYYDTIDEDLKRAKEILDKGRAALPVGVAPEIFGVKARSGTIYGADIYAAYKLLESFVEEIDRLRGIQKLLQIQNHRLIKEREAAHASEEAAGEGWREAIEINKRLHTELADADRKTGEEQAVVQKFLGLFSDYEDPCECFEDAQARWNEMRRRDSLTVTAYNELKHRMDGLEK